MSARDRARVARNESQTMLNSATRWSSRATAGLSALAAHLLALAHPHNSNGSHVHLDEHTELDAPSAALVLDREDTLLAQVE